LFEDAFDTLRWIGIEIKLPLAAVGRFLDALNQLFFTLVIDKLEAEGFLVLRLK